MIDFSGRTILYTGAAGGLGLPTTVLFLEAGATVIAVDNDPAKIAALAEAAAGAHGPPRRRAARSLRRSTV